MVLEFEVGLYASPGRPFFAWFARQLEEGHGNACTQRLPGA